LCAWAPDEQLFCLQNGKITPRNLEKVGAENYLCRLNEISPEDAESIEKLIIEDSPESLKESHRFLVHAFTLPHIAKRKLEALLMAAQSFRQVYSDSKAELAAINSELRAFLSCL
jgi:hypothetical protein